MTFRARPPRRRPRSPQHDEARRERLAAIGFIGAIVLAVVILLGNAAYGYYRDHFAPVARVDGTEINADQWRARIAVDDYRLEVFERRVREQVGAGRLSPEIASQYSQSIGQARQQLPLQAIEELIDETLQAKLAGDLAVTVGEADVDAEIANEATSPEERHVLVIGIDPLFVGNTPGPGETPAPSPTASPSPVPGATATPAATAGATPTASPGAGASPTPAASPSPTPPASPSPSPAPTEPTAAQITQARSRAEEAFARLNAGDNFGDVAIQYSTDPSGPGGGDLGFVVKDGVPDPAFGDALFALHEPGTTAIVEGGGHVMWIGRVTEIHPSREDEHYLEDLEANGVDREAYRASVAAQVRRQKMTDAIVAQATSGSADQVHAYEILIQTNPNDANSNEAEAHVRHILYSPNDDSETASVLPAEDPAWQEAQDEANEAAASLGAISDPAAREEEFAELASTSDDTSSAAGGGDLGWYTRATLEQPFGDAVFEASHRAGEIIGPVQTRYGWHVIMFLEKRAGARDRIDAIRTEATAPGADFAALARQKSEGSNASSGGDMGWIARYQLDPEVEEVLFVLQPGEVSEVASDSAGLHLYYVEERGPREADPDQLDTLNASAFANWYAPKKAAADIWRDEGLLARYGLGAV